MGFRRILKSIESNPPTPVPKLAESLEGEGAHFILEFFKFLDHGLGQKVGTGAGYLAQFHKCWAQLLQCFPDMLAHVTGSFLTGGDSFAFFGRENLEKIPVSSKSIRSHAGQIR